MVQERIGENLLLVGTAHVSPQSVEEVKRAVAEFNPQVVAVELDAMRLEALEDRHRWENTPFHKILRSDKLWLFLTQILLSSYQRRLGAEYGAMPGAEMLAAVEAARGAQREILLADRDVGITMKRAYRLMRFREKMRLSWELMKGLVGGEEDGEKPVDLQDLMKEDVLTSLMTELGRMAPSVKRVVIDERDTYLAARIQSPLAEGKRVVAVVGAGHLPGIRERLARPAPVSDLKPFEVIPEKRVNLTKILGWGFPLVLVVLMAYFGYQGIREGNWNKLRDFLVELLLWGGGLAAVGCLLARGHPLSILTAFLVAPVTILHPALAAGWFSGLVEAWIREPNVKDFQRLSQIESLGGFFNNRVIRILVVAALTNVGAMIGAAIVIKHSFDVLSDPFVAAWEWLRNGASLSLGSPAVLAFLLLLLGVLFYIAWRHRGRAPRI